MIENLGTEVEFEKMHIKSINIIICTPGRLLQHMDENEYVYTQRFISTEVLIGFLHATK